MTLFYPTFLLHIGWPGPCILGLALKASYYYGLTVYFATFNLNFFPSFNRCLMTLHALPKYTAFQAMLGLTTSHVFFLVELCILFALNFLVNYFSERSQRAWFIKTILRFSPIIKVCKHRLRAAWRQWCWIRLLDPLAGSCGTGHGDDGWTISAVRASG